MTYVFVFGCIQRTVKRLRLSKVKVAKYYDSGSLVVFYLVSLVWGINHIVKVSSVTSMHKSGQKVGYLLVPLGQHNLPLVVFSYVQMQSLNFTATSSFTKLHVCFHYCFFVNRKGMC